MAKTPKPASCHPDRAHHAKGMCWPCYSRWRYTENRTKATCHPDRPLHARGLCAACYGSLVRIKEVNRSWALKRYGMTQEDYDTLYREQSGLCGICKNPPEIGKNLEVDHDHITGVVRGLLCGKCNKAIGLLGDTKESVVLALEYFNNPPAILRSVPKPPALATQDVRRPPSPTTLNLPIDAVVN